MRDSSSAHDDETDRNASRDVREFRDRARTVVELLRDSSPPHVPHVGDTAVAPVATFGDLVPQAPVPPSVHEERVATLRESWSAACSSPVPHDYGCAVCGAALAPIPARDPSGRDVCGPCHERMTLPPAHLRFREEPIPGGVRLVWRLGWEAHWFQLLVDLICVGVIGYTTALLVAFAASGIHDLPPFAPGVVTALSLGPSVLALTLAAVAGAVRLAQRVEIEITPDTVRVRGSEPFGWPNAIHRFFIGTSARCPRVFLECSRTATLVGVPVANRREARQIVRQIESAMRRVVAHRRGYRG